MAQFSFVACLVGEPQLVKTCFEIAGVTFPQQQDGAGGASSSSSSSSTLAAIDDATADVAVNAPNGDTIGVSFVGRNALHLCDAVVLVCDSSALSSVSFVHEIVGRAGGEAAALPPNTPIVLLDCSTNNSMNHSTNPQQHVGGINNGDDDDGDNVVDAAGPAREDDTGELVEFSELVDDLSSVVRYVGSARFDPEEAGQPESALVSLIDLAANGVRSPRHVLWDGGALTEVGRQALRRSFWILDEDGDGLFNDAEISGWHRTMYGAFSKDDVNTMKAYARTTEASYVASGTTQARNRLITEDDHVTVLGFLAVCHIMLAEGRHAPLWVMLGAHGVGVDGRPYTKDEIEDAMSRALSLSLLRFDDEQQGTTTTKSDKECMLHLSPNGTSFFSSLYSRQRFSHPSDLFLFTPDCPWSSIYGLPNACEVDLPVHDFISCWRFMAAVDPAVVARFARYWAFHGDLASLFVKGKMRPYKHAGDVPPTAVFLVLGSPQCGKTSLMQRIADNDSGTVFADDVHPSGRSAATATVRARINNDGDVLIGMRELDEAEVDDILADERFMNTVSGILFCFDTSDAYSLSYLGRIYDKIAVCPNLPIVLAMCKADLPVVDQLGIPEGPRDFCLKRGIMWPPVFTSLSHLRALPGDLLNDVDNLTFILAEVAVNPRLVQEPAPSSVGLFRALKRAAVVATVAVVAFKVGSVVWRRYKLSEQYPAVGDALGRVSDAVSSVVPDSVMQFFSFGSSSNNGGEHNGKNGTVQVTTTGTSTTSAGAANLVTSGAAVSVATHHVATLHKPHVRATATQTPAAMLPSTNNNNNNNNNSSSSNQHNTTRPSSSSFRLSGGDDRAPSPDLKFHPELFLNSDGTLPDSQHHKHLKVVDAKRSWGKHAQWR